MSKAASSTPTEKTLDQIIVDQASNALAHRYSKDAKRLEASLLHCNFGDTRAIYDPKQKDDNGNPLYLCDHMEKTTFAHKLFENQVKKEEIVKYFEQVNALIGNDEELAGSYLNLANDSGKTILALIDEYDLKTNYQGIKQDIARRAPELLSRQARELNIDTHTGSVHGSVDQSFVRLANDYLGREVDPKAKEREIQINRDAVWNERIEKDFEEFHSVLTAFTSNDEGLDEFIEPTLGEGEKSLLVEKKKELLYKVQAAQRMIEPFARGEIIEDHYRLDPNSFNTCGLTLKEMIAIGYRSLDKEELWENKGQRSLHLMQFIDNLYVAKRGYNIDKNGRDEWKTHGTEQDDNKCQGGSINQIASGLLGNKLVEIRVVVAETMKPSLTKSLGKILPELAKDPQTLALLHNWLKNSVISEQLRDKLLEKLQADPEIKEQFSVSELNSIGSQVINQLKTEEIQKLIPGLATEALSVDKKKLVHQFVYDQEKGYVPYMEE